MGKRVSMIGVAVGAIALGAAFEYSRAQPAAPASSTLKVGVVSIAGVFNKSQRQIEYQNQLHALENKSKAELEALSKQVDAEDAQLNALKQGTDDYLKQMQTYLDKRAQLQSRQEYLKQQLLAQEKQLAEKLYQDVLKIVTAVAKDKQLDLVLERTEPAFPLGSDELRTTVSTYKVLYATGCVDLTADVLSRLNANP